MAPDLDDPRTFSEKIQWRKLYDRRQIFRDVTEKITARDHIADRVGDEYLIPVLGVGRTTSEIPLEDLTTPFVVKPTHWSGVIVRVHGPSELDAAAIARKLGPTVGEPYGIREVEWAYWDVPRRIMVERMLERPDGRAAFDYKIHVFGGRARFVEVYVDRFTARKCSIFDRDWRLTDAGYPGRPSAGQMKRPDRLDEMLEIAEALAGDLDYLRTDLYAPGDSIYVGEMTIYPASGFRRFDPPEWDLRWGELWDLPERVRSP